jgi:hypothetical protein
MVRLLILSRVVEDCVGRFKEGLSTCRFVRLVAVDALPRAREAELAMAESAPEFIGQNQIQMWVSPIIAKARFQAMQFLEPR